MPKGDYQRARGAATRAAIRAYFQSHPCCTSKDCALALGLRPHTISYHAASIRREWRNQDRQQ